MKGGLFKQPQVCAGVGEAGFTRSPPVRDWDFSLSVPSWVVGLPPAGERAGAIGPPLCGSGDGPPGSLLNGHFVLL